MDRKEVVQFTTTLLLLALIARNSWNINQGLKAQNELNKAAIKTQGATLEWVELATSRIRSIQDQVDLLEEKLNLSQSE